MAQLATKAPDGKSQTETTQQLRMNKIFFYITT